MIPSTETRSTSAVRGRRVMVRPNQSGIGRGDHDRTLGTVDLSAVRIHWRDSLEFRNAGRATAPLPRYVACSSQTRIRRPYQDPRRPQGDDCLASAPPQPARSQPARGGNEPTAIDRGADGMMAPQSARTPNGNAVKDSRSWIRKNSGFRETREFLRIRLRHENH